VEAEGAVVSEEHRTLEAAIRQHLPEAAFRHFDRCTAIATRAAAGNTMFVVESYDREFKPLKANISARDDGSVVIYVNYEDGRWHKESWVDGRGEITDGHHHRPELWAGGF
jgi:hypothetical protein